MVDGYLFFYDGRMPAELGTSIADAWYAAALAQFRQLRPTLERNGNVSARAAAAAASRARSQTRREYRRRRATAH
jgi:hypothetical protein